MRVNYDSKTKRICSVAHIQKCTGRRVRDASGGPRGARRPSRANWEAAAEAAAGGPRRRTGRRDARTRRRLGLGLRSTAPSARSCSGRCCCPCISRRPCGASRSRVRRRTGSSRVREWRRRWRRRSRCQCSAKRTRRATRLSSPRTSAAAAAPAAAAATALQPRCRNSRARCTVQKRRLYYSTDYTFKQSVELNSRPHSLAHRHMHRRRNRAQVEVIQFSAVSWLSAVQCSRELSSSSESSVSVWRGAARLTREASALSHTQILTRSDTRTARAVRLATIHGLHMCVRNSMKCNVI